jgi:hypothetical protein
MWSLGLILAEMYNGSTFQKAETSEEYWSFLLEVCGTPDKKICKKIMRKDMLHQFEVHSHFKVKKSL